MFDDSINQFANIKFVGVNTTRVEKFFGGLSAFNYVANEKIPCVECLAVDGRDIDNLVDCRADKKFRLLNVVDEKIFIDGMRGAEIIFVFAENVWENIRTVALAAHCAKKIGVPVIFIAGGNFEDAEDEIIFDALVKLPNEDFAENTCKIIRVFVDVLTHDNQMTPDFETFKAAIKNSAAVIDYVEGTKKFSAESVKSFIESVRSSQEENSN
ncbi:MAG: hypothetical protein K6G55_03100 [Selenomonadaceae bacterium]|nr:hypothetical protein [Selenomonadaceae bacterium]